jgi:hypothetical protein
MLGRDFKEPHTFISAEVICICLCRYFAIVHPLRNRTRNIGNRKTILALGAIWLCSLAFAVPFAIGTTTIVVPLHVKENGQITARDLTFLHIDMDVEKFKIYYTTVFVALHVVPFVALGIMYTRIAWKLWHPEKELGEQADGAGGNEAVSRMSERNRRRTTIMVIAVLAAFFVCFFPFHIYFISEMFKDDFEPRPTVEASILKVCLVLNAAINPIIYNILSENFRSAFRAIFTCCRRVKPKMNVGSVDTVQTADVNISVRPLKD